MVVANRTLPAARLMAAARARQLLGRAASPNLATSKMVVVPASPSFGTM
jgi:hypothetical protein